MGPTPIPPLRGVRVVSLAVNLPGPLACARLMSLGAEVCKVEPPSGDPLRTVAPGWYAELTAGQEVVTIDLKRVEGRAELDRRLSGADVLLTSMRPSALVRLGLLSLVERHGLVLVEIVGYDGDRADEAGHDLTYQAAWGTLDPPSMPLVPLVDLLGGERAVSATLAGIRRRQLGEPCAHERVVLDDAAAAASAGVRHGLTGSGDVLGGGSAAYGLYPSADGYVAVAAIEPHFGERLAVSIGATRDELEAELASETSAHWEALGRALDIPIVAVHQPGAAMARPVAITASAAASGAASGLV
ncbi:CoA transferase [Terrabacter carboxydivorans]|uniref:CoA transferase n=1 Tax=Terrabacter carboxydivorans TaxID=619730 RepID=A0ABN3KS71_9MICO